MRFLKWTMVVVFSVTVVAAAQDAKDKKKAAAKKPASTAKKGAAPTLKTNRAKVSYGIGLQIGEQLKSEGFDIDPQLLARGIADTIAGKKPAITQQEIRLAIQAYQREASARLRKPGADFLAANGKKKGVMTTKSGLQYKVLKKGTGRMPRAADTVQVHYRGTLIDGKVFDDSFKGKAPKLTDEPIEFAANRVIRGWTEALQLMNVGSVYQLFIPSELAYGARRQGPVIAPHSVLVFEVHLLGIKTANKKKGKKKGKKK